MNRARIPLPFLRGRYIGYHVLYERLQKLIINFCVLDNFVWLHASVAGGGETPDFTNNY